MKKIISFLSALLIISALFPLVYTPKNFKSNKKFIPSEWFSVQRMNDKGDLPYDKYYEAVTRISSMRAAERKYNAAWTDAGPFNVGGRITALTVNPQNTNIICAGFAAGGVFKSTNKGITWTDKTPDFPSLSIGALEMDPNNSNILYCGTGEANISTDSYAGFGLLKSTDAGETWNLIGLDSTRHIAEIEIHPLNSNILYVAASGGLYSKSPHRGIYKSTDAGLTWSNVLYLNDSTSAIDVAVDPQDVNRVYAAMWERLRGPTFRKAAGIASGIFLSTNGGSSWNRVSGGLPAQAATIGRISIAVAPSNPNYIYALYKKASSPNGSNNSFMAFYRSTNKGVTWTEMPGSYLSSEFYDFGWYFGTIEVSPVNHLHVYVGEIDFHFSSDGGSNWMNISNSYSGSFDQQHPDQHALWIDPANPQHLYCGNDGGVFLSANNGSSWTKSYDLPATQFYASTVDYLNPARLYGGTQDNGTVGTQTGALYDWQFFYGGDGFHTLVDYTNSDIIYAEYQFGGISRSTDGGQTFNFIADGIDFARTNWSTPYILDPVNPAILYLGTYKLHKTTNRGNLWSPISPDLTRGPNGRLGTITAISAGVAENNLSRILYVATDDAKMSVSTNDGSSWTDITGNLPRRYMTDVVCDTSNPAVAYVTLSGYNLDEPNAHVFRTTDNGSSWQNITGNMPDIPVNSLIIDYDYDSTLYVGTDAGVFYTEDLGSSWSSLGVLPNSPVFDLNFHQPSRKLFAGTHGRSMFMYQLPSVTGIEKSEKAAQSYAIKNNYPNPVRESSTFEIHLPIPSMVIVSLYDNSGKFVAEFTNEQKPAGAHSIVIDASKLKLASGVYYCSFTINDKRTVHKVLVIK
ncbi:MAG: T9SS type A sorting domain-containing protein [Ignavibacteriaceae bacterium]|nr:T9SS type A sorting domain-containing protein [Ignavibacteriaceae bacterium]